MAVQFKKIVRRFHTHNAFSHSEAKTTEELGIRHNLIFQRLVRRGVIVKSVSGKYYLDREKLDQYTQLRRKIGLLVLMVITLAVLIAYFSGAFSK